MTVSSHPSNICAVFSTASERAEYIQTAGAFLSPSLVLTTYKVGKRLSEATFHNNQGEQSLSARLEPVSKNKELGVSIIELLHPIGQAFVRISKEAYSPFIAGSLVNTFTDKAQRYPVMWDIRFSKYSVSQIRDNIVSLSTDQFFELANTGAPVFAPDGKTLATIVSDFSDAGEAVTSLGLMDMIEMQSGKPAEPGTNFLAANPKFFHKWMQEQARVLNLE